MGESLLSVGLDVGTTTSQLVLSRLEIENRAGAFSVPEMAITQRHILYRSPVRMTPLLTGELVDADALRSMVEQDYQAAGIQKSQVDTGAVIITGETSRKENAKAVVQALSGFAGDFVAATAGPHLESVLAAKGSGAVAYSAETGKTVLHMDIGGGTANLALIGAGQILKTGCLNVGGRLIRQEAGQITYVSPVAAQLCAIQPGDPVEHEKLQQLANCLANALEMAAGLCPVTPLLAQVATKEAGAVWEPPQGAVVISFSGGVADCMKTAHTPGQYGDMGPQLGQAIRNSQLCQGEYILGQETIRATVIGAGCHSALLSGSTVYHAGVTLPKKNLPVLTFTAREQADPRLGSLIAQRISRQDDRSVVLAFPGFSEGGYQQITALAEAIADGTDREILVCLEADIAKALGQKLGLLRPEIPCLCIDRVSLQEGSFLDIGKPVGPALPVVVKTLILDNSKGGLI